MHKIIIYILLILTLFSCKTKKKTITKNENEKTATIDSITSIKKYKFNEFINAFNIKDFGATGDGIHNDTEAILRCIEQIKKQGGGTIFFPKGKYLVARTDIKGKSWALPGVNHLKIIGENRKNTEIILAPQQKNFTRMLILDRVNDVLIDNITFNGNLLKQNNPAQPNEHLGGIFINSSKNIHILSCNIVNTGGDGITIRGPSYPSQNILIEDCFFDNNQRNGISLGSGFDGIEIKNCYFGKNIDDSPIDSEPEKGICQNAYIHHNQIFTPSLLSLGGNKNVSGKNFLFENNFLKNCSIFIHKADSLVIRKNKMILNQPKRAAITCLGYNNRIDISENEIKIKNKPAFYIVKTRYSKKAPTHINIINNIISVKGSNTKAFDIKGANNIHIMNNRIESSGSKTGIYIFSNYTMKNILIKNNILKGFETGIKINPYKENTIKNIIIDNNHFQATEKQKMKIAIDYKYNKASKNKSIDSIYIDKNIYPENINQKVKK